MYKKRGEVKEEKGFFARHKLWIATATLIGTIVGAGVLAIPYVVAKSGFLYGLLLILLLGVAFLFLNLYTGEIVLRTKEQHQLTGYLEKYLGKWGKRLMAFSMIFGIYGALTAYLIGEGQAIKAILGGGYPLVYSLVFFGIASFIVYQGVKATGKAELISVSFVFMVVFLIGLFSFRQINLANFTVFNPAFFFLPYGVILFAFMGSVSIPEMQEELEKEKKKMKKAILIGSVIPIVLYLLFSFVVVGLVGLENFELLAPNERIATVALSIYSHPILGFFANLFAVFTMLTSFLALGIALTEMYTYDFKMPRKIALLLTLVLPLLLVVTNLTTFISVIGLAGAVAGGVSGVLIVLAFWQAKKWGDRQPEYTIKKSKLLGGVLILLFALGMLYEVWQFFSPLSLVHF